MKVRIVRDMYAGYEIQVKYWWWPVWLQKPFTNTYSSLEEATQVAEKYKLNGQVVKEI